MRRAMKLTMTYTLPDEREAYEKAYQGLAMHSVLSDLYQELRSKIKHEEMSAEKREAYQEIMGLLHDLLADECLEI